MSFNFAAAGLMTKTRARHPAPRALLDWMEREHARLNAVYFDGSLPPVTMAVSVKSSSETGFFAQFGALACACCPDYIALAHDISDPALPFSLLHKPRFASDLMLHEMVHQATCRLEGSAETAANAHSARWAAVAQRITDSWRISIDLLADVPASCLQQWPESLTTPAYYLEKTDNRRFGCAVNIGFRYTFKTAQVDYTVLEFGEPDV